MEESVVVPDVVNANVGQPLISMFGICLFDRIWGIVKLSFHGERFGAARTVRHGCALGVSRPRLESAKRYQCTDP